MRRRLCVQTAAALALVLAAGGARAEETPERDLASGRTELSAGLTTLVASGGLLASGVAGMWLCDGSACGPLVLGAQAASALGFVIGTVTAITGAVRRGHALERGAAPGPAKHHPALIAPGVAMMASGAWIAALGGLLLVPKCRAELTSSGGGARCPLEPEFGAAGVSMLGAGVGMAAAGVVLVVSGARGDRAPQVKLPALGFGVPGTGAPGIAVGWSF